MNEKKWTDDERDEAFDRGMETMQRVALELYRRGREPLLEELEEARARNADMRAMLEQVTRERDEARAELSKLRADYDSVLEANVGLLDGAPYVDARVAFHRGAKAMREACARWMSEREGIAQWVYDDALSALPIPEEP